METFTIPQIVEQRICIAPMTKEQFEKIKKHKTLKLKSYMEGRYLRIYPDKENILDDCAWCYKDYTECPYAVQASRTIQFSQIDFEENKVENPESLVGKKMKGFDFDTNNTNIDDYIDKHVGEIGKIFEYNKKENTYYVEFEKGESEYPAELIHLHLVEEETPILCKNCSHPIKSDRKPYLKTELNDFCDSMCFDEYKISDMCESIKNKESEQLDLTKILIEGETYYSPLFGDVKISEIKDGNIYVKDIKGDYFDFCKSGKYFNIPNSEVLLFPSKEIRTWENYSPFKKGEICLFSNKNSIHKHLGFYFCFDDGKHIEGNIENDELCPNIAFNFCERFDKSKFNF